MWYVTLIKAAVRLFTNLIVTLITANSDISFWEVGNTRFSLLASIKLEVALLLQ